MCINVRPARMGCINTAWYGQICQIKVSNDSRPPQHPPSYLTMTTSCCIIFAQLQACLVTTKHQVSHGFLAPLMKVQLGETSNQACFSLCVPSHEKPWEALPLSTSTYDRYSLISSAVSVEPCDNELKRYNDSSLNLSPKVPQHNGNRKQIMWTYVNHVVLLEENPFTNAGTGSHWKRVFRFPQGPAWSAKAVSNLPKPIEFLGPQNSTKKNTWQMSGQLSVS